MTWRGILGIALGLALGGCGRPSSADEVGGKTLRIPMTTVGPKSLDPVKGSTTYEAAACAQVYETLFEYKYLVRPPQLEPALLAKMPDVSEDRLTYTFELKKGVLFHDDPCFPNGVGRELVASDVFYSLKRMADNANDPKSWWLLENTIAGFDAYREAQNAAVKAGKQFDYDAPVEGMRELDPHRFQIVLTEPVQRFEYVLEMFQTSVVPREAVARYGDGFSRHPVGTGPFLLVREADFVLGKSLILHRNPKYRDERYPDEGDDADAQHGFLDAAGRRLPLCDRLEFHFFPQTQPMWLEFLVGHLDYVTVPAENYNECFIKRTKALKSKYREKGITSAQVPLLDFIFRGFNMDDPLVGGYTDEKRNLRRAIHLAVDLQEFNDTFYNSTCDVYDGPIPSLMDGYPQNGRSEAGWRGPDLDRARQLLAEAGYPDGKGLPEIEYWTATAANSQEQTEMLQRQLKRIGVRLNVRLVDFSQLIEAVHRKKAQMFSFAWGSDYPDAENNLALFYGPNEAPGSNSFNYKNPEYDKLYLKIRGMEPSPERTKIYEQMRDMVLFDCPYIGSLARTRSYLIQPWLKNCKPIETWWDWYKYLDVDRGGS